MWDIGQCNYLLAKRSEDGDDFRRATLRRAPEVIQRRTRYLWVDTEQRASKNTVKGHHRKRIKCGCFFWMLFFFYF